MNREGGCGRREALVIGPWELDASPFLPRRCLTFSFLIVRGACGFWAVRPVRRNLFGRRTGLDRCEPMRSLAVEREGLPCEQLRWGLNGFEAV
jgi:hypothetical protein